MAHRGFHAAVSASTDFDAIYVATVMLTNGHTLRGDWYCPITVGGGKGIKWNDEQTETDFPTPYEAACWFVNHCGGEAVSANVERLAL